ncbi:MAG: IS256 family transposase [Actinobacteria bacterium]|nr:MAG: IS256 family transposase [Actinomycetota bacterium]
MAEGQRMTAAQVVDKLMTSEHADVLRESVAWLVAELIEAEVTEQIGAAHGERAPERRTTQRNGYRPREWDTRVGTIWPSPSCVRDRSCRPSILEPRRRAEQALVAVVQEAYVNGVSTRKVDRLVERLGLHGMSKHQASRSCRGLDEQVRIFREQPLEGRYPYLWLDAKVERVREAGGVRQKSLAIAYGVHESGRREVLGLDVGEGETESFWREFLRSLRARGLTGVRLCVSDAHEERDRAGPRRALAALLRALPARHARPRRQAPPAAGLRRHPRDLHGHQRRRGARAARRGHRPAPRRRAEGRAAARRRRGRPAGLLRPPARALEQAALDQPARARQPRDRPPLGRRRHLPQRRRADQVGRRSKR